MELGTFSEAEICTLIDSGAIMLDALAAMAPDTHFVAITQYTVFADAFEARYGLDRPGHTSDSTPVSHSALLEILHQAHELSSPISLSGLSSATRPAVDHEDSAPATLRTISAIRELPTSSGDNTPVSSPELATPIDHPSLSDTPLEPRNLPPEATTLVDGRTSRSDERLAAVIPSMPTLGDAPEGDYTDARPPRADGFDRPTEPMVAARRSSIAELRGVPEPRPTAEPRDQEQVSEPPLVTRAPTNAQLFEVSIGLGAWVVLFALLSVASHRFGLGTDEAKLLPGSLLFWARSLLLLGGGGILLWAFPGETPISRADFKVTPSVALAATGVGLLAGASFPATAPSSPIFAAILMVLLTAVAEELFFRAFLGRVLEAAFDRPLVSVGLAAALYGVYASTHAWVWVDRAPLAIVLKIVLLTIGAGVPYALLHHWTKSLIPPLVCHLVLNVAAVVSAVLR